MSYFSAIPIERGSLVKAPLRGKESYALVTESTPATELKSEIRTAHFQLKKIGSITSKPFLEEAYLEAVKKTADHHACEEGAVLEKLLPKYLLENPSLFSNATPTKKINKEQKNNPKEQPSVLQTTDEERFVYYKSLIREEFAKQKSVFICVPQRAYGEALSHALKRGIESFVFNFSAETSEKELKEKCKKVLSLKHPVVIIGTPKWLVIPRRDIDTIVIEKESESGWVTLSRPYIDLRFWIETYAATKKSKCILGDTVLRVETLHRFKESGLSEWKSVKWRIPQNTKTIVVDTHEMTKTKKEWHALSPELENLIREFSGRRGHLFVFAARKGLASVTLCRDCGEQVICNNCESPVVLYKTKEGGAFRCHQCGETRDSAEVCKKCKSWRLAAFGAGLERVVEEAKAVAPSLQIFEAHSDSVPTAKKAATMVEDFFSTPQGLMVGTEAILPYFYKRVEATAIASFDSLFSVPDFRIHEKIFNIVTEIKKMSKETCLIQTRNATDPTIINAVSGNISEFYKKEISDRKLLDYPPFSVFLKITVRGEKSFVERETTTLRSLLLQSPAVANLKTNFFASRHEKRGEKAALNTLIKVPQKLWPNKAISDLLRSLPPHFEIKINPDSLL